MTNSLCKTSVYKAYQDVINDVITNAREHFIEDGVDEAVLQELKQLWQTKLAATKAVEEHREPERVIGTNHKAAKQDYNNSTNYVKPQEQSIQQLQHDNIPQQQQQQLVSNNQVVGQVPPNNHGNTQGPMGQVFPEWRRVPIQLTIPSVPGSGDSHRILSIDVPEVFLQGHHLRSILTGQVISTTMGLPLPTACAFLQNHVNNAFLNHQQSYFELNNPQMMQNEGNVLEDRSQSLQRLQEIPQRDGPADSSDDDEDRSDEASDNDIDDEKEEDDMEEEGEEEAEEEPLNSGDDVSDADGTEESFETENVIVCQYDKITRSRNKWKFHLKDGIMNLNGEDFVFQKANGDAEW